MTFFADEEFRCKCARATCDAAKTPHRLLLMYLERMREMYGGPLVVTSGNRCAPWNLQQGGQAVSEHVQPEGCLGCDLACPTSGQRWRMLDAARQAGLVRIGIYPKHLHVGVGEAPAFPVNVVWLGSYRA